MQKKLNFRLHQPADRWDAFQTGVEQELRDRLGLFSSPGIVSLDGGDVDNDDAPVIVSVNPTVSTSIDVSGGTVVFGNGEMVSVSSGDIEALPIDTSISDAQVVRLEYGEVEDGDVVGNPYFSLSAKPSVRKKTPREMIVVETVTSYNSLPADVVARSVVIGVVRWGADGLIIDSGRDTYSFSRPWATPVDAEHRSKLGSGVQTDTNPHALSANDLSVGEYSLYQALVGQPACVMARPQDFGRLPGEICSEIIPAGNFLTDGSGAVTGKAGAIYSPLGSWPDRLLVARLASTPTVEVSAWIPKGKNVVAVFDPDQFASAVNLEVYYTRVVAGSLPGDTNGLSVLDVADPASNEILVAGGNFFTELTENKVYFTDVGLLPMRFDVLVDGTGRAYKSPRVLYCNTKLDTIGASVATFTTQPVGASRLRIGLSNFNPGFTEVRIQISGLNEAGSPVNEQVTFTGPLSAAATSFAERTDLFRFTTTRFSSATQMQTIVRNNDGPNTTITVFTEGSPARPESADDLHLATVHWTGSEATANYSSNANAVLDRRLVTRGGGKGAGSLSLAANTPALVETVLGGLPAGSTTFCTAVEDFNDPMWMRYPQPDESLTTTRPVELSPWGHGARFGYLSRKIPFASSMLNTDLDSLYVRLLPGTNRFPSSVANVQVNMTLYRLGEASVTRSGTVTGPYPPFQVTWTDEALPSGTYYAASLEIPAGLDETEVIQGWYLHIRS